MYIKYDYDTIKFVYSQVSNISFGLNIIKIGVCEVKTVSKCHFINRDVVNS